MEIVWQDLVHNCDMPKTDHLPNYGERYQTIAKHKCAECGQKWVYRAEFLAHDKFYWKRVGKPTRAWRKTEALRLDAQSHA